MAKALVTVVLWLIVAFSVFAAAPQKKQLSWSELSEEQQQILAPLAPEWDKLDVRRKRKWIGIAKRYPAMAPEERAKVEQNMRPWAKLTPEERRAARERYKTLQKLPAAKRESLPQRWEEYQRLPEEQRKQLEAAGKTPKPAPKSRRDTNPVAPATGPTPTPAAGQ